MKTKKPSPSDIVNQLEAIYSQAVEALKNAVNRFIEDGTPPDPDERANGAYCYPELVVKYHPEGTVPQISRSFGKFSEEGTYISSVTQPEFFRDYLIEQLTPLMRDYDVDVEVRRSDREIPYAYVWDPERASGLPDDYAASFARWFPAPQLSLVGDEVADGEPFDDVTKPLALFDGPRTDISLQRLKHYTGTPFEHFQSYVLFTNYHRYVDAFLEWAVERLQQPGPYSQLSTAGGVVVDKNTSDALSQIANSSWRRFQMPAYHLMTEDGRSGITLVNIGVGPSNAKTITDHLAVLRPQCWLMVGHCGGLRHSQTIGDYVLAHAYLRDDHVLDAVLGPDIPVPPIAEVQVALQDSAAHITGETGDTLKKRLRTGTVVTTDDRNWELRFTDSARRFNQSRAIAIDMESATIAANGYRLRVPYGTLLCVSDKPLHGEVKLPGAANRFYERAIGEHIRIGIDTLERLAVDGGARLHSRKLRAFDEPPFR